MESRGQGPAFAGGRLALRECVFDVIVVGGGPAGLSAALMLGRCRRRVLVCDLGQPRNRRSSALHGYLTRDGIAPMAFNELGRQELPAYGIEMCHVGVVAVKRRDDRCTVSLADGSSAETRFLLIATGVVDDLPGIAGFDDCYGRSLFHCPYCDGWEWRDRRIAAFGRGPGVVGLALGLTTWSPDVVVCTNGGRVDRQARARLERNGVAVRTEAIARLEHDDGALRAVVFDKGDDLACDAMFFATGQHPQSDLAIALGCTLNSRGTVKAGTLCDTNVPRVFVAGDASRDAQFVVVAAAEGVKAAVAINKALQLEDLVP
jgi:thioredoxin reductase